MLCLTVRYHGDASTAVSSSSPDPSHGTSQMTSDHTPTTVLTSVSIIKSSIAENTTLASHPLTTPLHLESTSLEPDCPVTPPSTGLGTSVLSLTLTPCTSASLACVGHSPPTSHPHTPSGGPDATPTTPAALESWECVEEVETEVELVSTGAGEEEVRCTCGSSLDEGFMIQVSAQ